MLWMLAKRRIVSEEDPHQVRADLEEENSDRDRPFAPAPDNTLR